MDPTEEGAMASAVLPPWDKENPEEAGLLCMSDYKDLINENRVKLCEDLQPDKIWVHLRQLHVLNGHNEETLRSHRQRQDIVMELLEFIEKRQRWHFHGFCRALALTDQSELIPRGGLEPKVYEEGAPQTHLPKNLIKMIRDHCKSNIDCLMKTRLFDFAGDPDDDITDISKLLVPVDLKMKDAHGKMVAIPTKEVLEQLYDKVPPRVARLYGDPGDGKTSLMMHIAHCWSSEFLKLTDKELTSKCPHWTTIVYLSARNIKGTVEEAIRDELGCKESDVDTLMGHVAAGDGTAVFMDSLDEVRDKKVLKNIQHYVHQRKKKGGPTVFIAARTGLCPIDPIDIDRTIMLQGFTEAQGMDYVELYREMCEVPQQPEQPPLVEYVTQYREELKSVLTNPLRLYIFCALAVRGELDLHNKGGFNIPRLFGPLERYLLRREGSEVTDQQRKDFYQLCMHGLLNGLREFPESLLDKFNIAKAYYIFLRRTTRRGPDGSPVAYYSFGHEMLYEYFASRYIHSLTPEQRKSLLLSICSNEQLRNVQYIVFQMLLEEWETQKHLIISMIRCMLILQFSIQDNIMGKFIMQMSLRYIVNTNSSANSVRNSAKIWEEVNNSFEKNVDRLQECGWFVYIYMNDAVQHVIKCLQASSARQQEILFETTICHLIPCKWDAQNMRLFRVGIARWGELPFLYDGEHLIYVTRPREAHKVLMQYNTQHPQERVSKVYISFNGCVPLGLSPETAWTEDEWHGLTLELTAVDALKILLRGNTLLTGMLQSFAKNMAHLQNHVTQIRVQCGIVPLDDLLQSLVKCKQVPNLSLELIGTYVVVPSGQDEAMLRAKRDRVCGMTRKERWFDSEFIDRPILSCPHWFTESWGKYVWSDNK